MNFEYKGILIRIELDTVEKSYNDENGRSKTRYDRKTTTSTSFWNFSIYDGDLTNFSYLKAIISIFKQLYWKRSGSEGKRIFLDRRIWRNNGRFGKQILTFSAKQKNDINYLHICQMDEDEIIGQEYFDIYEVEMLEIAITKATNLMQPSRPWLPDYSDPLWEHKINPYNIMRSTKYE